MQPVTSLRSAARCVCSLLCPQVWEKMPPSWVTSLEAWKHGEKGNVPKNRKTAKHKSKLFGHGRVAATAKYTISGRRPGHLDYHTCKTPPCVRVFAVYWPQWHATPLNNHWFGPQCTRLLHRALVPCRRVRDTEAAACCSCALTRLVALVRAHAHISCAPHFSRGLSALRVPRR